MFPSAEGNWPDSSAHTDGLSGQSIADVYFLILPQLGLVGYCIVWAAPGSKARDTKPRLDVCWELWHLPGMPFVKEHGNQGEDHYTI